MGVWVRFRVPQWASAHAESDSSVEDSTLFVGAGEATNTNQFDVRKDIIHLFKLRNNLELINSPIAYVPQDQLVRVFVSKHKHTAKNGMVRRGPITFSTMKVRGTALKMYTLRRMVAGTKNTYLFLFDHGVLVCHHHDEKLDGKHRSNHVQENVIWPRPEAAGIPRRVHDFSPVLLDHDLQGGKWGRGIQGQWRPNFAASMPICTQNHAHHLCRILLDHAP